MFSSYFWILYTDMNRTLAEHGITKEWYEQNKDTHPLYAYHYNLYTRCNKKKLKKLLDIIKTIDGIEIELVIKVPQRSVKYSEFFNYETILNRIQGE